MENSEQGLSHEELGALLSSFPYEKGGALPPELLDDRAYPLTQGALILDDVNLEKLDKTDSFPVQVRSEIRHQLGNSKDRMFPCLYTPEGEIYFHPLTGKRMSANPRR